MTKLTLSDFLKARVRTIRGWPKDGVNFRDVTTLFHDPEAFRVMVGAFAIDCTQQRIDLIAAVDARGFIVGGALAYQLHKPFGLVRKKGKLPHKTISADYALEYGSDRLEIHSDALADGSKVLIIDDLLATGGTAAACAELVAAAGGELCGFGFVAELAALEGRRKLPEDQPVESLIIYS